MMTRQHLFATLTAIALAALAACGGGGGADTGTAASQSRSVALQTYITDNLTTDYSKVWVSIKKITAHDASNSEVTLLDAVAAPVVVNLSSLAAVGQFMSTVSVPAGIYTEVRVTLDNQLQLVSLDGSTTTAARFAAGTSDFVLRVRNLSVDASSSGQLVLDFNLAKFTYDKATGLVVPSVEVPKPADAFQKFVSQKAELRGTVKGIDATAGTITIDDARLGKGIIVSLAKDAVLLSESAGKTLTLADLKSGDKVEIKGTVTPGATTADPVTVVATAIHVESASSTTSATPAAPVSPKVSGAGKVTAVAGSLVTVSLAEASFLPGANSVVVDLANAKFTHGVAADIVAGVAVEFRGTVTGTGTAAKVTATAIEIKGAPSQTERKQNPSVTFTAVNGEVTALNTDGSFWVNVPKADGPVVVPGLYLVNPAGAVFSEGKASCILPGAKVKSVGSLTGTTLAAKYVEVAGCGGQKRSEAPPSPPPAASAPTSGASAPAPKPGTSAPAPAPIASAPSPKPGTVAPVPAPAASAPATAASGPR